MIELTEEQEMIRDTVRDFVDSELRPIAEQIEHEHGLPESFRNSLHEMGFMGLVVPEEYGGMGLGKTEYCLMMEEISKACGSTAVYIGAHQSLCITSLMVSGTAEQKQKYLPKLATGEMLGAFALTEPAAGSDAANIQCRAEEDGEGNYILNGTKLWVTNGGWADIVIVYTLTDELLGAHGGVTAMIVEKDAPGFIVGKIEDKMGLRGSNTAELIFEDCIVPKENVLGMFGGGFITAMKTLDLGRMSLAAGCVGVAKEALNMALTHTAQREQFGEPLNQLGVVQAKLAEMSTKIYAMESMVYDCAARADRGEKVSRESAMCKNFCSDGAWDVIDESIQLHGGMGYMKELPLERLLRDCRINRIFEGANEIQQIVIARDLIKRGEY
jgi:alkylation response protein AidB-like acyl-CoA dehydrogenase